MKVTRWTNSGGDVYIMDELWAIPLARMMSEGNDVKKAKEWVKAINAHDELVAALKKAIAFLTHDPDCSIYRSEHCSCHYERLRAEWVALLAKEDNDG